jgi:radical SAM-linked protein
MAKRRFRIYFRKEGDLRFISHRDLVRTWERLFRRAGLQLALSQGFHPKPKMSFPAALAVGMVGANELMEVELEGEACEAEVARRMAAASVPGLTLLGVQTLAANKKTRVRALSFELEIPTERQAQVALCIDDLLARDSLISERNDGSRPVDVRPAIEEITLVENRLRIRLLANTQGGARPRAVLEALGLDDLLAAGHPLIRTGVELEP